MTEFFVQTLHGLTLGSLFALVAIGYTMVFGIIKLINFAHGEFYMAGGFSGLLALVFLCAPGRPLESAGGEIKLLIALLAAGLFVALLAVLVERFAYRPIRHTGRIAALLTAVGVSLLLQNIGISIFGGRNTGFPETLSDERYPRAAVDLSALKAGDTAQRTVVYTVRSQTGTFSSTLVDAGRQIDAARLQAAIAAKPSSVYAYPALTIRKKQIIIFAALAVSASLLFWLVQYTRVGRAMRAVSHDMQAASLMGIHVSRIVALTFAIGGFFAGVAGVLAGGMFIGTVDPSMGFLFGLKAFIAAVVGGIGNIPGALVGGLVLGVVEQYAQHYADDLLKGAGAYRDGIAFIILIGVLLVRPRGLFGKVEGEKV